MPDTPRSIESMLDLAVRAAQARRLAMEVKNEEAARWLEALTADLDAQIARISATIVVGMELA